MKLKKHLLVLATISVVLVSCGEDDNDVKQSSIIPMGVGNEWTFIDSTFNYLSGESETDTSKIQYDYYEVYGYSGYSQVSIEGLDPISLLNTDDAGNFVEYTFLSDTLVFRTLYYKKNAHKGETWSAKTAFYTDYDYPNVTVFEYDMKCICSDTLIHTPKGDFSCKGYSYSLNNGDDVIVTYLSENVGWVLRLHYEDGHLFTKRILLDYHIE